ncbi:uncharacterized protein N7446_003193 [Penicillium canescens]|uniref:Enoyl-CoA hydratase n=1 Tax=Penicillium canescens TaxID=5083 RepID=A0AAD6IFJ5_PENCN|nr:uncharacterized protein N7446_003193 [Penicillium canescens]KAJ6044992.1 hypothetical protein N7460_006347 [Penicillium canescens]KAJ6075416.1 hypothetical protein N7446_003193 [Penicillium canescens]
MTSKILTTLTRRKTGTLARITITRPTKQNALNTHLLTQLPPTIKEITETNKDLLAIILTGAGPKSFIGGADLREIAALDSPAAARGFICKIHLACSALRRCPVPVIARVNGFALGAGLEVAAACDVRVRLGIPSVVEAALLPGLIGWGRARRLLLLGETISADEALKWGLVEKVVEDGELDDAVEEWVGLLEKNGPLAVRRQKALISKWEELSLEQGIIAGVEAFGEAFEVERDGNGIENGDGGTEPGRMIGEFFRERDEAKGKV